MFKKSQRYSFRKGVPSKNLNTKYFNLRYQGNNKGEMSCAFVAGTKVDKRSVVRNKLKRRYANALKEITQERHISFDLVFYIKRESKDKDYVKIAEEIKKALEKEQILG